jgi:hypothetical protein
VTAYAANEAAIDFYRSHGFRPFELTLRRTATRVSSRVRHEPSVVGPVGARARRQRPHLRLIVSQGTRTVTTRITTPFSADSTAAGVVAAIDLSGRRAIVTGAAFVTA